TISPRIPTEVVDGNGSPVPVQVVELPIDFFDDFSWRSFIAPNWPAKEKARGGGASAKKDNDAGPRGRETWKADYEIFQPGGREPTEWASFDAVTPCPDIPFLGGGKERILASFSKFGDYNQATLEGPGNPMVAQNQTYARFEVRVNRAEFDF